MTTRSEPVPSSAHVARRLAGVVGRRHVALDPPRPAPDGPPANVVVQPAGTGEVAAVVQFAQATPAPLLAAYGAERPSPRGAIVLDVRRIRSITEVDEARRFARVEPGVTLDELDRALRPHGLAFERDPVWPPAATVGTLAAAPHSRFGAAPSRRVIGVQAVLASGEVLETGAFVAAGPCDWAALLLSSVEPLAVFTAFTLRLGPCPEARCALRAHFPSATDAARAVAALDARGIEARAVALLDTVALSAAWGHLGGRPPEAGGAVIAELSGSERTVRRGVERLQALWRDLGASATDGGEAPAECEAAWQTARAVEPGLARLAPRRLTLEVSLPPDRLADFTERVEAMRRPGEPEAALFGRGAGRVTVAVLHHDDAETGAAARDLRARIEAAAVEVGGAAASSSPLEGKLLRQIKEALDPNGILQQCGEPSA